MRHVFTNREEAKEKGKRAREHVVNHYSVEKVADVVTKRLQTIMEMFPSLFVK